jgi:spore coat protein U-like protein
MNRIESDCSVTRTLTPRILGLLLAIYLGGGATLASAVTCSVSTTSVAFGAYDVYSSSATNANGTLTVTCTFQTGIDGGGKTVSYTVSMSTGSSNSFVQRTMKSGSDALGYNLYTDNTYSVVWGDGTGGSSTVSGSLHVGPGAGNGTKSQQSTVYGRVPALQDVSVSPSYTDNVTISVAY